jgi:xanthosine phosphorylase
MAEAGKPAAPRRRNAKSQPSNPAATAAALIRDRAGAPAPRLAIVLGSGLGGIARAIEQPAILSYAALPGFPESRVAGHKNRLVLGRLGGLPVACLEGRVHFYEGAGPGAMAVPIRALRGAGIDTLLLTNAAGSLRRELAPGSLMLIADHINLQPGNPLIGPNDDGIGPRFPTLLDAYDPALRATMKAVAAQLAIALPEGIYLAASGPSFETPAEIRAFARLGADAVGMSTVPEVILARHCGMRVCAVSAITNLGEGLSDTPLSHEQTLAVAGAAARDLERLVAGFCEALGRGA